MAGETIGQRIKRERLLKDMTQRDLADAVGVGVPYISKIEADRETPADDKIIKIAEALRVDPDELLLTARKMPADLMDRLAANPAEGIEFLRKLQR